MTVRRTTAFVALLVGCAALHAREADPQVAPASAAFSFDGDWWWGDQHRGTVRLEAVYNASDMTWQVRDVLTPRRAGERVESTAVLDASLGVVRGSYERRNAAGFLRATYERDNTGAIQLEHRTDEYVNRTHPAGTTPAITTLAAWLVRCRHLDPTTGPWRADDFDPDPALGDPVRATATLRHHGVGSWRTGTNTRAARIWSLTRGTRTWRIATDPNTGACRGLVLVGGGASVSPRGEGPARLAPPFDARLAAPVEVAARRAAALRDQLPVPGAALRIDAPLTLDGVAIGRVWVDARPGSLRGQPVWFVTEATERRGGEAVVRNENTMVLTHRLGVVRGESLHRAPSGWQRLTFERTDRGYAVAQAVANAHPRSWVQPVRGDPVRGVTAMLLFLRHVPPVEAQYVVPGFDPRAVGAPKAGSGALATSAADATLRVRLAPDAAQLLADVQLRSGRRYRLVLDRDTRDLLRLEGGLPRSHWDPGANAPACEWFPPPEMDPVSARQAFVLFGRGYHLARRDWLLRAFHWPSMAATAPLQEAWIREFLKRSKHRSMGDCDDLLMQIFLTMKERRLPGGRVQFVTLPVYGGHTYTLQALDGRWWIVAVD